MKDIYKIETIKDLGNLIMECDKQQLHKIIEQLSESLTLVYHVSKLAKSKDDVDFKTWYWSPLDKFPSHLIEEDDRTKNGFTIEISKSD